MRRLVINKLAVHYLPAPSFVLLAQVTSSWVAVKLVGLLGFIDVDDIELALGHHEYLDDTGCHSYSHDGAGVGDSRTVDLLL